MLRLALALVFLSLPFPAHADITGKARVVDGDTIRIGKTKIRLHGIDAPETKQECYRMDDSPYRCGEAATDALRVLIGAAPGAALITLAEHLEQEFGAGLGEWHEAELVDDQQFVFCQLPLSPKQRVLP